MNETKTHKNLLSENLILHAKQAHIFDELHSGLIISLGELFYDDCITILDENDINILKDSKMILKGQQKNSDE